MRTRRIFAYLVFVAMATVASPTFAQQFTTDLENLQQAATDQGLPDFTRAYQNAKIFDAWRVIKDGGANLAHIDIGLIDTGVDATNGRHPEFEDVVLVGRPFALKDQTQRFRTSPSGHGTKGAGIVGANNRSAQGTYPFPQMNGIVSGASQDYTIIPETALFGDALVPQGVGAVMDKMPREAIVNVNLQSRPVKSADFEDFSTYWRQVFAGNSDKLFIIPAGNDNVNVAEFTPQNINAPNTLIVAGTNLGGSRAIFPLSPNPKASNFGVGVDIAAPAEEIYTPAVRGLGDFPPSGTLERNYSSASAGTSFSAPFVTGVAGLLKALNPSLSPADIKDILISPANTDPVTTDPDKPIGRRLNAHKAVCDSRTNLVCEQFTEWLSSNGYQQVFNQQLAAGRFPKKVEGRLFEGVSQFRGLFIPFLPSPFSFESRHGMTGSFFTQRNAQLISFGFERIWDQSFTDAGGIERFQATWTRGGSAPSSFEAQGASNNLEVGGTTGGGTTGGGW